MNRIYLRARAKLASLSDVSHACVVAGRLLLGLIAVLLPAMIWTERFTTFDQFFHGGQDCELSILALFAFLCLVILLSQRFQQLLSVALLVYRFLTGDGPALPIPLPVEATSSGFHLASLRMPYPPPGISFSPLRI